MFYFQLMNERKDDDLNYREYINSTGWKLKAHQIKVDRGYRCQLCNISGFIRPLHIHHNTYERLSKEMDRDLVVLCEDCHEMFHKNMGMNRHKQKIDLKLFSVILKQHGITYTNDDPYRYYDLGKSIIQHIVDGWDGELYDYYNKVNIEILDIAIQNCEKREFENARDSGDWNGYDSEHEWRSNHDYWVGWHRDI